MVESFDFDNFEFEKPKRWDGKWRILIFDIREKVRRRRDEFRCYLLRLGFKNYKTVFGCSPMNAKGGGITTNKFWD